MHDFDVQIREYIDATSEPLTIDEVFHVPIGEEPVRPITSRQDRRRSRRGWLVAAAVAAAVLVFVGGLGLLTGVQNDRDEPPVADQVEPEEPQIVEQVEPEEPPIQEQEKQVPAPPTTLLPELAEPSALVTGMTWRQVTPDGIDPNSDHATLISGGDRFLYVDVASDTVGTTFDGVNWSTRSINGSVDRMYGFVAWQDTIVGFGCGGGSGLGGTIRPTAGCVSVIRPDGTVASRSFDGNINDVGIGPSGIVVIVGNHYDEDGLQYAGEDVLAWNLTGRDINEIDVFEITDGVLHVEYEDQATDYVLSEHGYAYAEGGEPFASGWFSQNGEEWIPIPDFPAANRWSLIGTADGFVGISEDLDGDPIVWHSSNGLDWRDLGQSPGFHWPLSRWNDGALVGGTESIWYISARSIEQTPLLATENEPAISASGNVGMVRIDIEPKTFDLKRILYSPRGEAWIDTNVPPEMRDLELTIDAIHNPVEAVATDTNVLMILNLADDGGYGTTLVFFLGTPITG